MSSAIETLLRSLSPDVVDAIRELVAEEVAAGASTAAGDPSPWLSIGEAAEYLRMSERTIERAIASGRLQSHKEGRRRLLHRDRLDAFVRAATGEGTVLTVPPDRRQGVE